MSRSSTPVSTTIVIPTMARPSLDLLLEALAEQSVPVTAPIVLVDDRPGDPPELVPAVSGLDVTVVRSGGGGPARARNIGWRHARTPWVSFLDDDVLPGPDWWLALLDDLAVATGSGATGTIARLRVPLPRDRPPPPGGGAGPGGRGPRTRAPPPPPPPPPAARRGGRLRRAVPSGVPRGRRPGTAARRPAR